MTQRTKTPLRPVIGLLLWMAWPAAAQSDDLCGAYPGVCGLLDDAVATAGRIGDDGARAAALAYVAGSMATLGQIDEARGLIAEAREAGEDDLVRDGRMAELAAIGAAQAMTGLTEDADATMAQVREIADGDLNLPMQGRFVVAMAWRTAGQDALAAQSFQDALAHFDPDANYLETNLQFVTASQNFAGMGMFAEAFELAERLSDDRVREAAMVDIALAQAAAGLISEAEQTIEKRIGEAEAYRVYVGLAAAQARADRIAEAEALVAAAEAAGAFPFFIAPALQEIAAAQARAGMIEDAMATVERIEPGAARAVALARVAEGQVSTTTGDAWQATLSAAKAELDRVGEPSLRFRTLMQIGTSLAKTGLTEVARQAFAAAADLIDDAGSLSDRAAVNLSAAMADAAVTIRGGR